MRKSLIIKIVAVIITVLFFVNTAVMDLSYAYPDVDQPVHGTVSHRSTHTPDPNDVIIPGRLGYIEDIFQGSSGKMVFHIKDAHCNYDAQRSIYDLIDWIVEKYGVDLLNLEGGTGEYDLSILEDIKDTTVKERISDDYLRSGRITGAELYRVFNPESVRLSGIEDANLYEENLRYYKDLLLYKAEINAFLEKAGSVLEEARTEVFSEELNTFLLKKELFDSNQTGLDKYLPYLVRSANSYSEVLKDHPNILFMSKLLLKEKDIDFKEANNERKRLVDRIIGRLSRYERVQVLSRVEMFDDGQIDEKDFHDYLIRKSEEVGIKADDYRQITRYREYLSVYSELNEAELFNEIEDVEKNLSAALCKTEKEKELFDNIEQLHLLKDMFRLKLRRKNFESSKGDLGVEDILSFTKGRLAPEDYRKLEKNAVYSYYGLSNMMRFYSVADERDNAFVLNIGGNMEKSGVKTSIVITGGFHSKNLLKVLKQKNISYISISPSFVNAPDYRSPYMDLLSGFDPSTFMPLYSLFSSTIQLKSLWSRFGIDTDFAASFLLRLNTAIEVEKGKDREGIVIKLDERKVLLLKAMGYKAAPNVPEGYENRPDCGVIDVATLMNIPPDEYKKKLSGFLEPEIRFDPANGFTGNKNMADILRVLLARYADNNGDDDRTSGTARKKAYLRTFEGHIVEQELKGMGDVDTFDYVLDVQNGVLTCVFSCGRTMSGFMTEPSVVKRRNEKWYLLHKIQRVYQPGIAPEDQKKILQELLDEQREYEERGECGWQWVIDRDENGEILVNDALGYGLRGFRIFDRSMLPRGMEAQNLEADADAYGGKEMVQEMVFEIIPMRGDRVRIKLINSWGAQMAAYTDTLTGLYNRRYFFHKTRPHMVTEMNKAVILFIDIDHFKHFNDDYPEKHAFGDRILKAVSNAILRTVRGADVVFRWGGEEFVIVLPEADVQSGKIVGTNILSNIKKLRPKGLRLGDEISVTVGVVPLASTRDPQQIGQAIDEADVAMMEAKQQDMRGIVIAFDEELPAHLRGAAAIAGADGIPPGRIVRDLNDIMGIYMPALIENLREFLIGEERIRGTSQSEGLHRIFLSLQKMLSEEGDDITEIKSYWRTLDDETKRDHWEGVAVVARKKLKAMFYSLSDVNDRMMALVGDKPATSRVNQALLNMQKILDLLFKYLTDEDRKEIETSPFQRSDGDSVMWLDGEGNVIWHPAIRKESDEFIRWNRIHEKWHLKLNERYPKVSKMPKEIAAIYLAYEEMGRIRDGHLEMLKYAIFPEFDLTPHERRHEGFVPGAIEYLVATTVGFNAQKVGKEAVGILDEVLYGEARQSCVVFNKDRSNHEAAVEIMAYIGLKRPELVKDSIVNLFEIVLKTEGVSGKTYVMVCEALADLAKRFPKSMNDGTVRTLMLLSEREGYERDVYEAALGAFLAIARARPDLITNRFSDLHPLFQIKIIEELLELEELVPGHLREGDRKGIKIFCSYRIRQYLSGGRMPEWLTSLTSSTDEGIPGLPFTDGYVAAITPEQFLKKPGVRAKIKEVLARKYIRHMVTQLETYGSLEVPALRGELTSSSVQMPDEKHAAGYNATLAMLLGFDKRDKVSHGETTAYYSVPDSSHYMTEAVLIHVLKECGLILPVGMHHFSQFIRGRMPDEAKYIQIANVILYPVRYDWESWQTDNPVSGIPPIAYGAEEHRDHTVFNASYLQAEESSLTGVKEKEAITYDEAMEYFLYMQSSKQLLSWALQADLVLAEKRTSVQANLSEIWSDFQEQLDQILKEFGVHDNLSKPTWISEEPMDEVGLNELGWSYGSEARRESIKEGLVKLESTRRENREIRERTLKILSDAVRKIRGLVDEELRKKQRMNRIAQRWGTAIGSIMEDPENISDAEVALYGASKPHEILVSILSRIEGLFTGEISNDFKNIVLSDNVFSIVAETLLDIEKEEKEDTEEAEYSKEDEFEYMGQWLSRIIMRMNRFPGETRVVVYPVYDEVAYAKETKMTSELRRRMGKGDYGVKLTPIPYLAGDAEDLARAMEKMDDIVTKDNKARSVIFADGKFYDNQSARLKETYAGRVMCVKEKGMSSIEQFTYIGFYLRSALALAAIDYFDTRNNFGNEHRRKLEDMIAALLVLITGDKNLAAIFKEDPARLINGIITLRPAERMSWEDVDEKMRASEQFLHSL